MAQDINTVTIRVEAGAIVLDPDDREGDRAVGRKNGTVRWKGSGSIGTWVVALKDRVSSPFKHDQRAFTGYGEQTDGGKIRGDTVDGDLVPYSVFVQEVGATETLFLDPIIIIRNSPNGFAAHMANLTEDLAADAAELAAQAEYVAAEARRAAG